VCALVIAAVLFTFLGPVFGWRVNVVFSGSMEPEIRTGNVIITGPVSPEEVVVGDIIIYSSSTSFVTHRVIDIVRDPSLQFITKGDANEDPDPTPIPAERLAGRFVYQIANLGYVIAFLKTPLGLILTIGIPLLILVAFEVQKRWIKEEAVEEKEEAVEEKKEAVEVQEEVAVEDEVDLWEEVKKEEEI